MQYSLKQQLGAIKHNCVSEDQTREFPMMFKDFDKDKFSRLDHQDLKACLHQKKF